MIKQYLHYWDLKNTKHKNDYKYKAENKYNLHIDKSFYLFIDNISNEYFARIDSNNKK